MVNALNKRQKQILLLGIALMILSELFPPWVHFDAMTSGRRSAGYHLFTQKPESKSRGEVFGAAREGLDLTQYLEVKLDNQRTLLQRLFLSLFTLALIIIFKNNLSLGWMIVAALISCLSMPLFYFWLYELRSDYQISQHLISQ